MVHTMYNNALRVTLGSTAPNTLVEKNTQEMFLEIVFIAFLSLYFGSSLALELVQRGGELRRCRTRISLRLPSLGRDLWVHPRSANCPYCPEVFSVLNGKLKLSMQ